MKSQNLVVVEAPPQKLGSEWWLKLTAKSFKAELAKLDYEQCEVLLEATRLAVRETTLRSHVEALSPEQQKLASRLAPVHTAAREAVLTWMHSNPRPNAALAGV